MSLSPKASVIIPTFNDEASIIDAINSILRGTLRPFEILVIDDNSTDYTIEKLQTLKTQELRLISNKRTRGPSYCRNLGLSVAHGEFVFFTDADCLVDSRWIEIALNEFNRSDDIVGVVGKVLYTNPNPSLWDQVPINPFYNIRKKKSSRPSALEHFAAGNIAYRRNTLTEAGGFNVARYTFGREDTDLGYRMLSKGKLVESEEMIVTHRKEYWSIRSLLTSASRYQYDVYFYKDHGVFPFKKGKILHPWLLDLIFCPWKIFREFQMITFLDFLFVPILYLYLVALRLVIWNTALRERVWIF